jgi:hypothetical protein
MSITITPNMIAAQIRTRLRDMPFLIPIRPSSLLQHLPDYSGPSELLTLAHLYHPHRPGSQDPTDWESSDSARAATGLLPPGLLALPAQLPSAAWAQDLPG